MDFSPVESSGPLIRCWELMSSAFHIQQASWWLSWPSPFHDPRSHATLCCPQRAMLPFSGPCHPQKRTCRLVRFNSFSAQQSCGVSQCSGDLHKNDQDCTFKTPRNCSTNILFLDLGAGCIDTFSLWKFSKPFTYVHFSGCPLYSSKNVLKNHLNQMNQNCRFGAWEYSQNSQVTCFRAFTLSRNKRFKTIVPVLAGVFVGLLHYSFHKRIFFRPRIIIV